MVLNQADDPLTGLRGFEIFNRRVGALLASRKPRERHFAVGLFDLDGFGRINQAQGREAGDALLRALASGLAAAVGERGEVFRYGGDAFSILLPAVEKEDAFLLLEQARAAFGDRLVVEADGKPIELAVSVSGGVAAAPDDSADTQDLLRKVQAALYRAKVSGPGKVCLAREEKMVTKTSHYGQGQLEGLTRLAKRLGQGEAALLREALDDLLRKYNA